MCYTFPLDSLRISRIAELMKLFLNNNSAIKNIRFDDCMLQVKKLSLSSIFIKLYCCRMSMSVNDIIIYRIGFRSPVVKFSLTIET